jgi:hypothetical protein
MGMRFSLRVAAWSLRYGLTQLVVLCFAALAAVAVGGVVVALLASLAARIALPLVDRDLDARFDQAIATLNQAEEEAAVATLNHAAERLESVAAELGVQLAPAEILDRPRPTQQARDVFAAISDDVLAVCRLAPAAIDLSSYPRYEVWRRYQRPRLDEAMAIVLEEDPPTWSNDPARFQDGPATDLSGQLWFQRVLVAEVAIAASEGDSQAAAQALEASWRLNQALRASPQLPAHQTATAVLELQLAALGRRVAGSPVLVGSTPRCARVVLLPGQSDPTSSRDRALGPASLARARRSAVRSPADGAPSRRGADGNLESRESTDHHLRR